ncbi:MAG: FHA domain-containing protein [Planctomycetota bacterium]|nr:FHA domain-containing protein [Planctomycetota bacterium]
MACILVVSGPSEGLYSPLGKRVTVVGRDEGCTVQVLDERVSRKHIQIRFEDAKNTYVVLDMKSANGLFINGRRIEGECELRDNDEIQIGNTKILFMNAEFPDKASAMNAYKQRGQRMRPTIEQR